MVTEFIPLRPASRLDSKISVGRSPRLDTDQGWLIDCHGMLGEVEKLALKVELVCVTAVFKVPHREVLLSMTIG